MSEEQNLRLKTGDKVRVKSLDTIGTILDIDAGVESYPYYVDLPDHPFSVDWFDEDDLELLSTEHP